MFERTVIFINYHLSELLQPKPEEIESKSVISFQDRQKYRRQISSNLIREQWISEAVNMMTKSRDDYD